MRDKELFRWVGGALNDRLTRCKGDASFDARTGSGFGDCGGSNIITNENNTDPWDSTITDLTVDSGQFHYPTHALKWSQGLAASCTEHSFDKGVCALTGHGGQDGSDPAARAKRFISYKSTGENLAYG